MKVSCGISFFFSLTIFVYRSICLRLMFSASSIPIHRSNARVFHGIRVKINASIELKTMKYLSFWERERRNAALDKMSCGGCTWMTININWIGTSFYYSTNVVFFRGNRISVNDPTSIQDGRQPKTEGPVLVFWDYWACYLCRGIFNLSTILLLCCSSLKKSWRP